MADKDKDGQISRLEWRELIRVMMAQSAAEAQEFDSLRSPRTHSIARAKAIFVNEPNTPGSSGVKIDLTWYGENLSDSPNMEEQRLPKTNVHHRRRSI